MKSIFFASTILMVMGFSCAKDRKKVQDSVNKQANEQLQHAKSQADAQGKAKLKEAEAKARKKIKK